MRIEKTATGYTLWLTNRLYVHVFFKSQIRLYMWHRSQNGIGTPWFLLGINRRAV